MRRTRQATCSEVCLTNVSEDKVVIAPRTALSLAQHLARLKASALGRPDLADDLSGDALLRLFADGLPLSRAAITLTVRHEAWRLNSRLQAERRSLQRLRLLDLRQESDAHLDTATDRDAHAAQENTSQGASRRLFADGSLMLTPTKRPCPADIPQLSVIRPDGTTLRGHDAVQWARVAMLAERVLGGRSQQASNAARACAALARDQQILSVATLPWREALARLAALGISLSRAALRSNLRAARRRALGKTAHSRATA